MARHRLAEHVRCPDCAPDALCDAHKEAARVKRQLRLVGQRVADDLETHRWARQIQSDARVLVCLECYLEMRWDPRGELEPPKHIARCPGQTMLEPKRNRVRT